MSLRKFGLVLKWLIDIVLLLNRVERIIEFIKDMVSNYLTSLYASHLEVKVSA